MNKYHSRFPQLFQFFGGYFYQGWASDYRWDGTAPDFRAVVRHFKAVNPPATVVGVGNEMEDLLALGLADMELKEALTDLGNNYYPTAGGSGSDYHQWLEELLGILRESPVKSKVLREVR